MSNIYIQEPPTHGKILLVTSAGDIDIELWSKEAPKACRNFVQLCMEGYYDNTIFHRVVHDFIVQGGDPTGTGHGGDSIYGSPFKDEFHTRLRFSRRGLVAMANAGPDDNGSQFFFTFGPTAELQRKHTIFGKVVGNTLYNMLKLQDVETNDDERPLYPHKIVKTEILSNPFDDIVPRDIKKIKKVADNVKKTQSKSKATKNFSLLSFGEEAEEDEQETNMATKTMRGKSKSSHDLINDPKLSSVPAVQMEVEEDKKTDTKKRKKSDDEDTPSKPEEDISKEMVQKKLKKEDKDKTLTSDDEKKMHDKKTDHRKSEEKKPEDKKNSFQTSDDKKSDSKHIAETKTDVKKVEEKKTDSKKGVEKKISDRHDKNVDSKHATEKVEEKKVEDKKSLSRSEELRAEVRKLQKELSVAKKQKEKTEKEEKAKDVVSEENTNLDEMPKVDMLAEYKQERQKFKELRKQQPKGSSRESATLELLAKFQAKLSAAKKLASNYSDDEEEEETKEENEEEEDPNDISWMCHKLRFVDKSHKVLDANVTDADRYEIFDPRNPITKRRREASKQAMKEGKREKDSRR
ncbi:spliceosome-associated protein CWC27 homolog [Gigantopelta aegis]|uniref:spliceosome-associated protein CWC27 homolog n=1 Tax=Gigantopelta aegis TaxID=1735272 RepID=UPI001B8885D1|nr:spliceosome-associated protein CWC27 homolog [Gigantopelta aegis]